LIKKIKLSFFSLVVLVVFASVETPVIASNSYLSSALIKQELNALWVDDPVGYKIFVDRMESRLSIYENAFKKASKDHDFSWKLLAAISYQESHWDPRAISNTGVRGLMMLTQRTAKEVGIIKRTDPYQSISGGAVYFNKILNSLPDEIPFTEKVWMSVAAYNLGYGNIVRAKTKAKNLGFDYRSWDQLSQALVIILKEKYEKEISQSINLETTTEYVERVKLYYRTLNLLDRDKALLMVVN